MEQPENPTSNTAATNEPLARVARQDVYASTAERAKSVLSPPPRSAAHALAIACRMLAMAGHNASFGLASQVTLREDERTFWTQTYGLALEEAQVDNQVLVDLELNPLRSVDTIVNPANRFHAWIYRRRPEIGAIVHTHAFHASALSMIGVPLTVSHMDTVPLFDAVAHLGEWPGVPFGDEEGAIISEALGTNKAILLAHHGLVTVGAGIEEACTLAMVFEQAARLQLAAMASGLPIKPLPAQQGRDARRFADDPLYALAHFEYYARAVTRQFGQLRA